MKIYNKYLITLSIIAILLFSLFSTANPWIWLIVMVISGLLPMRIDGKVRWTFLHYFACAVVAMGIFYLTSPPEPEIVDAMGELFPLQRSGYLAAVCVVSAGFYSFLSLTVTVIAKALFRGRGA